MGVADLGRSAKAMSLRVLLLCGLSCVAFAADDVVRMKPYQVSGRFLELTVTCEENTDRIEEARVIWVAPGSAEEKRGIRRGDRLVAINGAPIVGKNVAVLSNFSVAALTFEGRRGLFRKKSSITIEGQPLKDEEPNQSPERNGHRRGLRR